MCQDIDDGNQSLSMMNFLFDGRIERTLTVLQKRTKMAIITYTSCADAKPLISTRIKVETGNWILVLACIPGTAVLTQFPIFKFVNTFGILRPTAKQKRDDTRKSKTGRDNGDDPSQSNKMRNSANDLPERILSRN